MVKCLLRSIWWNHCAEPFEAIYLARESNRIPILPHFVGYAQQIGGPAHKLPVSDVFDLSRVSMVLDGMSIVEIHELRQHDLEHDHLKMVSFDGEFEQMDKLGRPLVPGDLIVAEPAETEALACWSWSLNHGRTAFLSGFDGKNTPLQPADAHQRRVSHAKLNKRQFDRRSMVASPKERVRGGLLDRERLGSSQIG